MSARPMPSPCMKVCTLDPSGRVCVGCLRTAEEIVHWAALGDARRSRILESLPDRHRMVAGVKAEFEKRQCPRCGASFGCGAGSGKDDCWCTRYPPVEPVEGESCLCPACLAAAAN